MALTVQTYAVSLEKKLPGTNDWYVKKDGVYETNHFSYYTNKASLGHSVFYVIHITNGNTKRSNNSLYVSGNETITDVSIVGGYSA